MREKRVDGSASSLSPSDVHHLMLLLDVVLLSLTVTRWLVPTEATPQGETLWIAGLWFLLGAVIFAQRWWTQTTRKLDIADIAVGLLVGGHVLSGAIVLFSTGDRRATCNLLWEWLSIGVSWFAWRARLNSETIRRLWLPVLIVTASTLSVWGLWQYFIWYPQTRAEYGPVIEQVLQQQAVGQPSAGLLEKLSEAGIPSEGPALQLFLNRVRDSREPFGPFGLANTLGGLLAAWLVVGLGVILRNRERRARAILGLCLMPIVGCLYLTNSRTAWGGALIAGGAATVLVISRRSSLNLVRRGLFPLATSLTVLAGSMLLMWITRNAHEIPGPLKSLSYRAEYWIGSLKMLSNSPWKGVGLGQFRERYLPFRLPVSSEEIADPHNLLLDVWASGGMIGLAGLLGLLGILLNQLWKNSLHVTTTTPASLQAPIKVGRRWMFVVGLASFGMVIIAQFAMTGLWDSQVDLLLVFAVVWCAIAWLMGGVGLSEDDPQFELGPLAALALSVHLLGAGGIAMPAVTELWLLLIAVGLPIHESTQQRPATRTVPLLASGCCGLLLIGWFFTGWRPTVRSQYWLAEGDTAYSQSGDIDRSIRMYRRAVDADDWSPELWQRLADAEFTRANASSGSVRLSLLEEPLSDQNRAIERNPFRSYGYLRKGEMLAAKARITQLRSDWDACLEAYQQAEARHPTRVETLMDYAQIAEEGQRLDLAEEIARKALIQNEINRERGHQERFLSESQVGLLQRLSTFAGDRE